MSLCLITLSSAVSHSPNEPVTVNILEANELLPPITVLIPFANPTNNCLPISIIANNPLNVLLKLFKVGSLILKFSVKLLILEVMLYNCSDVVGGNISLNAPPIALNTSNKPVATFLKDSIKSILPPKSFHPWSIWFLASALSFIIPPITSLIPVNNSLASLKSPIIISHVCAHPEPKASLRVLINWVNVFTSVAASWAVLAIAIISCIWDSVYPWALNSASDISPVNSFKVSSNTSEVSHPFPSLLLNDSLKDWASSTVLPIAFAVLFNASWNTWPPIPALTTEFQSSKFTLPAAIAWDNWYIAALACWDDEPDIAAKLAIPLIAWADVSKSTPAAVKVPILRVISVKL